MKNIVTKIFITAAALLVAVNCFAASADEQKLNVLCVGNSLLSHGANQDLGWSGTWGMAASSEDKDYYHQLQNIFAEEYPDVKAEFKKVAVSPLERVVDTDENHDYTSDIKGAFDTVTADFVPDVVTLQIGDNTSSNITPKSYAHALVQIADYFKKLNPDVAVVYSVPFFASDVKQNGTLLAAEETGFACANLRKLNKDENKALGLFEHSGVANHPGDKGMRAVAEELFSQIKPVLDKGTVKVKLDSTYLTFDVAPQIIEGRTMVPLRAIFEALGAEVKWDDATKTVSATRDGVNVALTIGKNEMQKDTQTVTLDVPAQIVDSRTLVPVRAISEAFECDVNWDADNRTVLIKLPKVEEVGIVTEIPKATADKNEFGFYSPSTAALTTAADPDDAANKVFLVTCKTESKVWNYIWCNMQFKAGQKYRIEADVRPVSVYGGIEAEKFNAGMCFHHAGKDNGVGFSAVSKDGWTHLLGEYTIPGDYEYREGDDRIGIYFDPVSDKGVTFMVDNISVTLID